MRALLILLLLIAASCSTPVENDQLKTFKTETGVIAENAMVVSAHPLASQVGVDILKKGGNAVDAAVAVQFALAVTYPAAGNIGGGGFMVYRSNEGEFDVLDFREKAPARGHRDMYIDETGTVIEGASRLGHLANGVPGSVAGMVAAHERYGALAWEEVVQPSVDLALNGFLLTAREARGLNRNRENFMKYSTVEPEFLNREFAEGDSIKWTGLGHTMERIRDGKNAGFYEGKTADLIVAEMERGGGWISHEDLKSYEAKWREPIISDYKGYKVVGMPPVSSGGVALAQLLEMVEPYPVDEWGWNTPKTTHLMVEAERRVYADRATHLGDPDFHNVPVKGLIDSLYLLERMSDFTMDGITPSDNVSAGAPAPAESEETTHFSIIDADGNAVSITTTLNGGYGNKVVVGEAGFLLNNEMDDFSIQPGYPNMFGLIGGEANSVQGGKRMLSSMTPTIIEKDGKLYMVVGTPGGSTIITSVFQAIINVLEHGFTMQGAVAAPRFHHQWKPTWIRTQEGTFSEETKAELEALGHELQDPGQWGRIDAILVRPDGTLEGGADPRGDDKAIGY